MIRHVSVWLDALAPRSGAFAQALDWAARLGVALQAVVPPAGKDAVTRARVDACADACAKNGIPWEGAAEEGRERILRPLGLCAFGTAGPARWQANSSQYSRREPAALLLCPDAVRPVGRPLVLSRRHDNHGHYLPMVAQLCQALRVAPVILLLADSEEEAADRQSQAAELFAAHRVRADFDCIICGDPCMAVACVARWRDCSHIVVEREAAPSAWHRWMWGDLLDQLLHVSASRPVLAFPRLTDPDPSWPGRPPSLRSPLRHGEA